MGCIFKEEVAAFIGTKLNLSASVPDRVTVYGVSVSWSVIDTVAIFEPLIAVSELRLKSVSTSTGLNFQ